MDSEKSLRQHILPQLRTLSQKIRALISCAIALRPSFIVNSNKIIPGYLLYQSDNPCQASKVCLFSHFNAKNRVDESTIDYLRELKSIGFLVVCISTSHLRISDINKLSYYCQIIIERDNIGLDFASWKCATEMFPTVWEAKELLLANDSVLCIGKLAPVFSVMDKVVCDFWGMTASQERCLHLQSYFICLRRAVTQSKAFRSFWAKMRALNSRDVIIRRYESTLTLKLLLSGFVGASFVPLSCTADAKKCNPTMTFGFNLWHYFGMPLLKKRLINENPEHSSLDNWQMRSSLMDSATSIDVLLPTCNGERWLPSMLSSLLWQKGINCKITIRDDASDDNTRSILESASNTSTNVNCVFGNKRIGVVANISELLSISEMNQSSQYFALADQDDIWYLHKLHMQYVEMKRLESHYGDNIPLLVCSDARGIDEFDNELFSSFLKYMKIPHQWGDTLQQNLELSHVLGCSVMGNAPLRRLALPIPQQQDIFMHDWWLLLVATCFGKVFCMQKPTLDYRQHSTNFLGAPKRKTFKESICRSLDNARRTQRQAATFLQHYQDKLTTEQYKIIEAWAQMPEKRYLPRLASRVRWRFWKPGLRWIVS
ncbi:rhamnan synthesis F family protein [Desulfovibrio sp.]|uniref:rhamnan synthesis F family protein n=1 Tax=Desulfovibrio sp. TaxID=885 RepID=UPI0025B7D31B|nr:rhamnan synthesis F family protein [Desulfovibrio sp.]